MPELEIRERIIGPTRYLGLVGTLRTSTFPCSFRNPFGIEKLGRHCEIALIDGSGAVLRTLVEKSGVSDSIEPDAIEIPVGGVVGRCHLISPSSFVGPIIANTVSQSVITPGKYRIIMLVSDSAIVQSPRGNTITPANRLTCRSNTVDVMVDKYGVWSTDKAGQNGRVRFAEFVPFESEYTVDSDHLLTIVARVISPRTEEYVNPWLSPIVSDLGPLHVVVQTTSGERITRFPSDRIGSGRIRDQSDCIKVPEDGVIGGTRRVIQLSSGTFVAHATIDESYLRSGCFDDRGRIKEVPFWNVLYSSPPVSISVQ